MREFTLRTYIRTYKSFSFSLWLHVVPQKWLIDFYFQSSNGTFFNATTPTVWTGYEMSAFVLASNGLSLSEHKEVIEQLLTFQLLVDKT